MSLISVNNVTFHYDGSYDNIFDNLSLQIDTDWRLGFIGRNGRGKTTLFHLLLGDYEYSGTISASAAFDYFPYTIKNPAENTIDILDDIGTDFELWQVCRELTLLQVDCEILYRPFETLSQGEQTKVMLAILFSRDHHFLLIDEPTNHLDNNSRLILMDYLRHKTGFILVSHDRHFLDGCIDHVLALNKANILVSQGNFTTWWENKKNQDAFEAAENERLKKDISRLDQAAKRTKNWSDQIEKSKIGTHVADRGFIGHKAAKMMNRAKAAENRLKHAAEEKAELLKNVETADNLKLFPLTHHKETLVRLEEATIRYDTKTVVDSLNLTIKNGQRVVLSGKNGCGKSSILKAVMGTLSCYSGTIDTASGLIISYVPQDTSFLRGDLNTFIQDNRLDETLFKALLRKLDFSRIQFEKNLEDFSGGQKKKVLIAKSLCERAHLYIWDEPLNFIDIFSRMQIEQLIREYQPAMLLVEHDSYFIQEINAEIVTL